MKISDKELSNEIEYLNNTIKVIRGKISNLGEELIERDEKALEFKKFMWDSHTELDPGELKTMMSDNDLEISLMMKKGEYLQKLFKIQNKPYFGNILFKSNDTNTIDNIYIGITHLEDNYKYLIHDWRSPICSLFYDYEKGNASYTSPQGEITGEIIRKRQYTIEDGKLIHVFDNDINIDDELLQEVLATESDDKMKNIVNTIQQEQNKVIRDIEHDNLIVQGIAGSGKTSVALHRIAFLLYKINYLSSDNVLIFSPNQIFSEYISNVLPELGEKNTMQTTMNDFLKTYLKEFKNVESFTNFIQRYYQYKNKDNNIIEYKQSDEIIKDIEDYVNNININTHFQNDIIKRDFDYTKQELNSLLKRYNHFPLFKRIDFIAEKICDKFFEGKLTKKKTILKLLYDNLNINKNYIEIYQNFFTSIFSKYKVQTILNKKEILYEDATIFVYLKSLLEGFDYNTSIRQIVIDEAQDYTKMQYILLNKLFRNAKYTILGDINQTINPFYKYKSLDILKEVFPNSYYIELNKTYRSSKEIIEYTNTILNLNHVSAIRRESSFKVLEKHETNKLKEQLLEDLKDLSTTSKSIAIICKTEEEVNKIYELLKNDTQIIKIDSSTTKYDRKLVVIPSYISKGLEFDSVIVYNNIDNKYSEKERNLFYVSCTRSQHRLIVYNRN